MAAAAAAAFAGMSAREVGHHSNQGGGVTSSSDSVSSVRVSVFGGCSSRVRLVRANLAPNNSPGVKASGIKMEAAEGSSGLRDEKQDLVMNGRTNGSAAAAKFQVADATSSSSNDDLEGVENGAPFLTGLKSKIGNMDVEVINGLRQGRLLENRLVYRQTFVIRSYEVGADKTVSIDTLNNLFQDVALNHVWASGLAGDGFGATHAMMRNQLIWVVTRMHVQVDRYPAWGDVIEIDSWVGRSGKNGMRRDWLVRDYSSGQILGRATSTWVMLNKITRRLSKMPDAVKAEISPWFIDRSAMTEAENCEAKISKLDDASAQYIKFNLTPKRSDLDMNQHVNNVKYIGWMMESVGAPLLESHELASIIVEYRRECGQDDTVQALSSPEGAEFQAFGQGVAFSCINSSAMQPLRYTHLIRTGIDGSEILRGRTIWRRKECSN